MTFAMMMLQWMDATCDDLATDIPGKQAMDLVNYTQSLSDSRFNEVCNLFRTQTANYTREIKFSSTANYGCGPEGEDDVYTVDEFKSYCGHYAFVDYDGHGYPVKDSKADDHIIIRPSKLHEIPLDATHIVWYNR